MKSSKSRYINASSDAISMLANVFKCTEKFVYMALTYSQNSDKARLIRYFAVNMLDAVPMLHVPECTTLFVTLEDGRELMRQNFNNGAVLRIDKSNGDAWITNSDGNIVANRSNIKLGKELSQFQALAENL